MKIDGGCHCGYISYEAEVDRAQVMICHCTDCQTLSGSAFRTVVFTRENTFKVLVGTPKIYIKTAESGIRRQQCFCPECGTPIYSAPEGDGPRIHIVRVGTARQRDELVPATQIWARSAQCWLPEIHTIERNEKQPSFDAKGGATTQ